MASVNMAIVVGFLGDEPKVTTMQNGRKIASMAVATTEKGYTLQNGTQIPDKTEWHNIVLFGKVAEVAERYLHKGSSVYIQGKMQTRSYDDRNGIKRYVTEIVADQMQMLDKRQDAVPQAQAQTTQAVAQNQYSQSPQYAPNDGEPDVPF